MVTIKFQAQVKEQQQQKKQDTTYASQKYT